MQSEELRTKFLEFFKARGHAVVSSSSLIPDDPSVLLTTAGMQQFKPYYTGAADPEKDFGARSAASIQKSFRTSDIDEVGDESHLTFFEMMGNFSFGGYQKKEAITLAYNFIAQELGLPISYVTIFKGSEAVSKDIKSSEIWKSLGVSDVREEGMDDVFWGPTGSSGPCGPTTEIYCKNAAGQDIEVWNIVFNQFFYPGSREELLSGASDKKLKPLEQFGVDTGMGLERLAMIAQNTKTIFDTDLFDFVIHSLPSEMPVREKRIVADHARAVVFLITDGVRPSNKDAGYILRRLIRRLIVLLRQEGTWNDIFESIIAKYKTSYPAMNFDEVWNVWGDEYIKFSHALRSGLRELKKMTVVSPKDAFRLYESYGLPFEVIKDFQGGTLAQNLTRAAFDEEFKKHQEISRAGTEKKFGGHGLLLDTGEFKAADEVELKKVTRLHTATHLMQAALRKVLGPEIQQMGSDITAERTRFDFSFPRKVTSEELKQVEELVNNAVKANYTVEAKEMPYEEALKTGALHFFSAKGGSASGGKEKYPGTVTVYSMIDPKTGETFSRELCGGPHVSSAGEIGAFKILKEESSSAGVRRIRATVL